MIGRGLPGFSGLRSALASGSGLPRMAHAASASSPARSNTPTASPGAHSGGRHIAIASGTARPSASHRRSGNAAQGSVERQPRDRTRIGVAAGDEKQREEKPAQRWETQWHASR